MRLTSARTRAAAAGTAGLALLLLFRAFPPSRQPFYPRCPLREWLGWLCPGCGATRAMEALLAGRWAEAVAWNAAAVALAAACALFAAAQGWSALRWNRWRPVRIPPAATACLLTAAALFGLARNIAPLVGAR